MQPNQSRCRRVLSTMVTLLITGFLTHFTHSAFGAEPSKGTIRLKVDSISALHLNGSPFPAEDCACKARYGNLIGKEVETAYDIGPKGESFVTTFEKQAYPLTIWLGPKYNLGSFYRPSKPPLQVYAVIFSSNSHLENATSTFVLELNDNVQCEVVARAEPSDLHCDVSAGPLWNQKDADGTCPKTCAAWGGWNGQWTTMIEGQLSVCGCKGNAFDLDAGPLFNEDQAKKVCPRVADGVRGVWNGQWRTTVEGRMSVCGTRICAPKPEPMGR